MAETYIRAKKEDFRAEKNEQKIKRTRNGKGASTKRNKGPQKNH